MIICLFVIYVKDNTTLSIIIKNAVQISVYLSGMEAYNFIKEL